MCHNCVKAYCCKFRPKHWATACKPSLPVSFCCFFTKITFQWSLRNLMFNPIWSHRVVRPVWSAPGVLRRVSGAPFAPPAAQRCFRHHPTRWPWGVSPKDDMMNSLNQQSASVTWHVYISWLLICILLLSWLVVCRIRYSISTSTLCQNCYNIFGTVHFPTVHCHNCDCIQTLYMALSGCLVSPHGLDLSWSIMPMTILIGRDFETLFAIWRTATNNI